MLIKKTKQPDCLPDNLDDAGNNQDTRPRPCFVCLSSYEQLAWLDHFQYKMDREEPAEERRADKCRLAEKLLKDGQAG